jgi:Resolvase, N terminal domain
LSTQTRLSGRIELKGLFSTFTNLEIPRQPREQKALPKQARSGRGLWFDRLTRSLADFAKLVEPFDAHDVSFVSVTQEFNTTTSMGRLTLNVLLSFAQFEREVTSERIRDKIAASKRKGLWVGGPLPSVIN